MKILKEENSRIWTDEAEKMLSYFRAGSIDSDLEKFTKGYFKKYDMGSKELFLKGQKDIRNNKDDYDDLIHIMPKDEYNKLKVEFIKKYNTPIPKYDPWTHEFSDNGVSHRSTRDENGEWVKLDLRHLLGLEESLEEAAGYDEPPFVVSKLGWEPEGNADYISKYEGQYQWIQKGIMDYIRAHNPSTDELYVIIEAILNNRFLRPEMSSISRDLFFDRAISKQQFIDSRSK